jgi:hypothetical protein
MEVGSFVISVLLFAAFVPGVLTRIPPGGTKATVLVVHAVLFAITVSVVMTIYWGMRERFGNYGAVCPNGFRMTEGGDCVAAGHATYTPGSPSAAE